MALAEKISKGICFDEHSADAELVEERPLWKRQILLATLLDAETDKIVDQDGVCIAIPTDCVGRPLLSPCRCVMEGINTARVEIDMIRVRPGRIVVRVNGGDDPQSTRH